LGGLGGLGGGARGDVLLLRVAPRLSAGQVVLRAAGAVAGAGALLVLAMLAIKWGGARPSPETESLLLSAFFTAAVLAMTNAGAALARTVAGRIAAFHARNNAANLLRAPVGLFLAHRPSLERAAAVFFWLGSGQMLYGAWFDLRCERARERRAGALCSRWAALLGSGPEHNTHWCCTVRPLWGAAAASFHIKVLKGAKQPEPTTAFTSAQLRTNGRP